MGNYDAYYRNKAKQEASRKKPFVERWRIGLSNPDRVTQSLLVVFTFGIVAVGFLQWCTLKSTLTANKLDQRAWVSIKIDIDGDFTYSLEKGAEIPLKVTISNVGHEPAFNILPSVKFLSSIWVGDDGKNILIIDRQKQICDRGKVKDASWHESIGQSLLPSEVRTFSVFKVRMDAIEFKRFLERSTFPIGPRAFTILIGGCFNYTFINGEGGVHQTGFIYSVDRKDNRAFLFDNDGNGVTRADEMDLEPWAGVGQGFFAN